MIVSDNAPRANPGGITATPSLRLERVRSLAGLHAAVCRARQQGLVCSRCSDDAERVRSLAGELAASLRVLRVCSACNAPATHADGAGRAYWWCDVHAWSGDAPLADEGEGVPLG